MFHVKHLVGLPPEQTEPPEVILRAPKVIAANFLGPATGGSTGGTEKKVPASDPNEGNQKRRVPFYKDNVFTPPENVKAHSVLLGNLDSNGCYDSPSPMPRRRSTASYPTTESLVARDDGS